MKRVLGVLGTFAVVFLMLTILLGQAGEKQAARAITIDSPQVTNGGGNISSLEAARWTVAAREWTASELAAAQPYPMPERAGTGRISPDGSEGVAIQRTGTPGLIPAAPADNESFSPANAGLDFFFPGGSSLQGYEYPAPFTRYVDPTQYKKFFPAKAIGKLYFYQNGVPYTCTAASIGGFAIWTAGHCLHAGNNDINGWSYNAVFVPSYQNGRKPNGQWTVGNMIVKTSWFEAGDLQNDLGGAILNRWRNKMISQRVGALGFAWNHSPQQHWFAVGYPSTPPFTGGTQAVCAASFAYSDAGGFPGDPPVGIGCDQAGDGTSGGPWIMAYNSGNYLNGIMAYRYTNHPLEILSPYFDDDAYVLYNELVTTLP